MCKMEFKKEVNGETWYNLRHIQMIITVLAVPIVLLTTWFVSWVIGAFILIWTLIGIVQIQKNYINRGMKYAPDA